MIAQVLRSIGAACKVPIRNRIVRGRNVKKNLAESQETSAKPAGWIRRRTVSTMRCITIALVFLIIAGVAFTPYQKTHDDGLWPVSVTVCSASGRPIKAFSAEALMSRAAGEAQLNRLVPPAATRIDNCIYAGVQEPFLGQPLEINVPFGYTIRGSLAWNYKRYFQYRGLLIVVEWEGGKLEGRALELPDLRVGREVNVEFP